MSESKTKTQTAVDATARSQQAAQRVKTPVQQQTRERALEAHRSNQAGSRTNTRGRK